jgi:hypothetical protein
MNLPPMLKSGAAAQVLNATGTVDPASLFPGTSNELTFSLPLPAGFTVSATSDWMVTLPPGFTLPSASSGQGVNFFGLAPYAYNAVTNPPSTLGPFAAPIDGSPAGTLWVWSTLNNAAAYSGITLQFILRSVLNPTTTGTTGSFAVRIGGTNSTNCIFTVPGITIAGS